MDGSDRLADEATEEFRSGVLAFSFGYKESDNPYQKESRKAILWLSGWVDEQCRVRVGHVFTRHGIHWRACCDQSDRD